MPHILITKSTGEREAFDGRKLMTSLLRAGASQDHAKAITAHIEGELIDGISTNDIYRHAFDLLRTEPHKPVVAARYSIRRAVGELGPDGFPFEKLVAEIFKARGYEAVTDQIVYGHCVEHEVDVVAWKEKELLMAEAKFHNEQGIKSDLKVALYIKARFDDLKDGIYKYGGSERPLTAWRLVTNTKFTDHAIRYAECVGLSLIGWNYPAKGNLEELITESKLHPITSLVSLSSNEKHLLLSNGVILVRQIKERESELLGFGIDKSRIPLIIAEINTLYS